MIRTFFLIGLALISGIGSARASPTNWVFIETALYQAQPDSAPTAWPLRLPFYADNAASMSLSETAVQRGSISYNFEFTPLDFLGHVVPGSDTDFAFNTLPFDSNSTGPAVGLPAATCCETTAHLALDLSGGVLSGELDFANWADLIRMPIVNNAVTLAYIAGDREIFGCFGQCYVSGLWVDPTPVPEPSTILLLMAGLGLLFLRRSRQSFGCST